MAYRRRGSVFLKVWCEAGEARRHHKPLVRYPAGVINPRHTHPCGHGMFVLEGELVTHRGAFGPGSFVWFPEGEVMEHGASPAGDVVVLFITNKAFRIDYV
jgi:quercetin dioxygenase-like cupin family protein